MRPGTDLTGGKERLAGRKGAYFAEPAHPLDLDWIEIGKHLIAPLLDNRLWWQRHDDPKLLQRSRLYTVEYS